ncbi:MAG: PHB depolymerase family esterase [Betaproteobacteria bacterium]
MTTDIQRTMQEAMRLMQAGDLHAATQAIQDRLRATSGSTCATGAADNREPRPGTIEGQYQRIPDGPAETPEAVWSTAQQARAPATAPGGEFVAHTFVCEAGTIEYKLFVPARLVAASPPLIVMLHGCTQSPDDFARGTRMNALAQEHGYVVAYPEQSRSRNSGKCWNWFRSHDQKRGQGEPALIAALTRHLVAARGIDERRVYAAGLSAGGAMAAVLASTYPDIYAAIGVHSGLPFGVAHDLPSALAAMQQRPGIKASAKLTQPDRVPAIVFHGDRDTTVTPCNGAAVVAQFAGRDATADGNANAPRATVENGAVAGGRAYTRTVFSNADGTVAAEQWVIHGAAHAWSGGDPAGSYTDPSGPNATEHMLRFLSTHKRKAIN